MRNIAAKEREREEEEKSFVIFALPPGIVFRLQLQIRSPLDRADFLIAGSEKVILHSVQWDCRYDI